LLEGANGSCQRQASNTISGVRGVPKTAANDFNRCNGLANSVDLGAIGGIRRLEWFATFTAFAQAA